MEKKGMKRGKAPAKGRKAQGGAKKEDERDETLQAVILADSFETRFNPFSLEAPRCLLPLANTPLIEYTLEFLAMSGVQDIYIYCGAHTSAVESYIQSSKWCPTTSVVSPFSSLEIIKTTARSVGDALRDLDARDLITGDFLLVHGDLVSNLPIDDALAKHRARRIADKNAIMTMVLREGGLGAHRTKSQGVTPVFIVDLTKDRCLHYEETHSLQANKYINLDPDLLADHSEMEIRTDLIDCGIDICTPDVLALWAESFDYEVPRRHFLHGVLKDYELNGKTIHLEVVGDHYAARAFNLQSYEAISKDVLSRYTYPLVPDSNLLVGQSYSFEKGGICKENGVILARTCKVGKRTVLGRDTSIGDGSMVSNSIVGRRCQIGKNVTIKDAYIWDDVAIGDGATVTRAIIASEAVVGRNCTIHPGALLSYGVRIGDSKEIASNQRITRAKRKPEDDYDDDKPLESVVTQKSLVGDKGEGYLLEDDSDAEDDGLSAFHNTLLYSTAHLNLSTESISTLSSDLSATTPTPRSRLSSFASISSDEGSGTGNNESFHHEAVAGLLDTLREARDFDSAKLEFMGLRLSNNASDHQIRRAIATAFIKRVSQLVEGGMEASKAAGAAFGVQGAEKFVREVAVGLDLKEDDQVDFLEALQKDAVHRGSGGDILAAISLWLYQKEIVEEEAFLRWWDEGEGDVEEDGELKKVREGVEKFIVFLKEAEEESSEEESD